MKFRTLVLFAAVLSLVMPATAQYWIYFYVGEHWEGEGDAPLTEDCTPNGTCLPEGRLIGIYKDLNNNGPDPTDPPWDDSMPSYWYIDGYSGCGTAELPEWGPTGGNPPYPHGYLRVFCGDSLTTQYVSPLFTCSPGQNIAYPFEVWTCTQCTHPGNLPPTAVIDSIVPNPAHVGGLVFFGGHGTDTDGIVVGYRWWSSLDGFLNAQPSFHTSALSPGTHLIQFEVQDDDSAWSTWALDTLRIAMPEAVIDSIVPNPVHSGHLVSLGGHGTDIVGTIIGYNWRSSLDGQLSTQASFATSTFSTGEHTIYFKVQDNDSVWSPEVSQLLPVVNLHPVAIIDSMAPNPAQAGAPVFFGGHGSDDESVIGYEWRSGIDGLLSMQASFSTTTLSPGIHQIFLRVLDNDSSWSTDAMRVLIIRSDENSTFCRTYGSQQIEEAFSVQPAVDGGYVLAGLLLADDIYLWLVGTAPNGDSLWSRQYVPGCAQSVRLTTDGGYIVAGWTGTSNTRNEDVWLLRTSAVGETLWTRSFGGNNRDEGMCARQTADGGFVVAGSTQSFVNGHQNFQDAWLVRTGSNGDSLWSRTFDVGQTDYGRSVEQTTDGGFVLAGETYDSGSPTTFANWLLRTDANGDSLWCRLFSANAGHCGSVALASDGGFALAGAVESAPGNLDFWLVKMDINGNTQWSHTYGGPHEDVCMAVRQTTDGGFVLAGETRSFGAGDLDFWLLKLNANGDSLWSRTFGGTGADWAEDVQQTSDGGYVLAGWTESFGAGSADFWLVKIGPEGGLVSEIHKPIIAAFALRQNFPNPFNSQTEIVYDLPRAAHISLRVYDLLGREVVMLKDGVSQAGSHRVTFDGSGFASGIYFARLEVGSFSQTKKLVLLK